MNIRKVQMEVQGVWVVVLLNIRKVPKEVQEVSDLEAVEEVRKLQV